MKVSEIIEKCNKAIPRSVEYSKGEEYGAYNIPSLDMDVEKILYCVTPTKEVVSYFHEHGYDLLISHHPFIAGVPQLIYHTALDCCEGGLNDMWADRLGLKEDKRHFDDTLGWYGELEVPIHFSDLLKKVRKFAGAVDGQVKCEGDMMVETVVICSGLGGMVTRQAEKTKADCYILGEATMSAEKMDFPAVIETGHTNSEWHGVIFFQRLFEKELEQGELRVVLVPGDLDYFGKEFYKERRYESKDLMDRTMKEWDPDDYYDEDYLFDDDTGV